MRTRSTAAAILSLCLGACATTHVSAPAPAAVAMPSERLQGRLEYSGSPDYLPRMLQRGETASGDAIVLRYAYDVSYDVPTENGMNVFNPLLIAGVPKSTDVVLVKGVLEIVKQGAVVKRYEKSLMLDKSKTLFSEGETLSDMRRKGLLMVRDYIDEQLVADAPSLRAQLARP